MPSLKMITPILGSSGIIAAERFSLTRRAGNDIINSNSLRIGDQYWLPTEKPCLICVGALIKTGFFYSHTLFMPPPFC